MPSTTVDKFCGNEYSNLVDFLYLSGPYQLQWRPLLSPENVNVVTLMLDRRFHCRYITVQILRWDQFSVRSPRSLFQATWVYYVKSASTASFPALHPHKSTPFECYIREGEDGKPFADQSTTVIGESEKVEFSGPSTTGEDDMGSRCVPRNIPGSKPG